VSLEPPRSALERNLHNAARDGVLDDRESGVRGAVRSVNVEFVGVQRADGEQIAVLLKG
jgi:hypothetical protein